MAADRNQPLLRCFLPRTHQDHIPTPHIASVYLFQCLMLWFYYRNRFECFYHYHYQAKPPPRLHSNSSPCLSMCSNVMVLLSKPIPVPVSSVSITKPSPYWDHIPTKQTNKKDHIPTPHLASVCLFQCLMFWLYYPMFQCSNVMVVLSYSNKNITFQLPILPLYVCSNV